MRLRNKITVITGATGGIGRAIAEKFYLEGAQLLIVDVNESKLKDLKSKLEVTDRKVETVTADVSKEGAWQQVSEKLDEYFEGIDVLVNNAGVSGVEGLLDTNLNKWEFVVNNNLQSVYLGMHYLVPKMISSGGGSIINISSIFGLIGSGKNSAYTASKSGITGLTKTVAIEFAKNYIRANTIHPGVIRTPMTYHKFDDKETYNQFKTFTPWPDFGEPEDIAYGAMYLASDEAKFITGSELVIDGGYTCQ